MKKHLIAAAVAATVAIPAAAQVTVYGRIDASIEQDNTGTTDLTAQTAGDYRGSSVLGFRGSEDLGGGLKASFALEGDLNVQNGKGDGTGGGLTFDRQSWVGIGGSFGSVKVGRTSDAVDSIKGQHSQGYGLFDTASTVAGAKLPQMVRYDSPAFNGVTLTVSTTNSNNVSGGHENSFGLTYKQGPLTLAYANATQSISTTAFDDETGVFHAGYNFGIADVKLAYQQNETGGVESDYVSLGVKAPLGQGFAAVAHLQNFDATSTTSYHQWGVALEKAFSKRTAAYVGYRTRDVDGGNASDQDLMVIGIDHAF
jgi:predicted porin